MSQNRKDLQTKVARIRQTLEKVLDQNISLAESIGTLFSEQGISIFSILTALSMTILTIVLAITGVFGGGRGVGDPPSKDEEVLKKWFDWLANAPKRLVGKAVEALPAIVGSVVGAILSFFGKALGFVAEHTWAVIVFTAGLMSFFFSYHINEVNTSLFMISLKR